MTSNTISYYAFGMNIFALYIFISGTYSASIADSNKPDKDSTQLFMASYIICILQSISYIIGFFYIIVIKLSDEPDYFKTEIIPIICMSVLFITDIYWLVAYSNYNISGNYNDYAFYKTTEFFVIIILIEFSICIFAAKDILCVYNSSNKNNVRRSEYQRLDSTI